MFATLGGRFLIDIALEKAYEAFGKEDVVVAIPDNPKNKLLKRYLKVSGANVFAWDGDEWDVLGRFYHCASLHGLRSEDKIFRWTPDDYAKVPELCRAVAEGETGIPVEFGGECFSFQELSQAHKTVTNTYLREHLTYALGLKAPPPPEGTWTIDTVEDLEAVNA